MKKVVVIVGVVLIFGISYAAEIKLGDTKGKILKVLGKPDLITTREELKALISPKPINLRRYKNLSEFWIYYSYPKGRNIWGYVDFDREGLVADFILHSPKDKVKYVFRGKSPDLALFKTVGKFRGQDWLLMPDKSKFLLIIDIMDRLRKRNIFIRKSPFYYLEELDQFYKDSGHSKFTVLNTIYCFAVLNKDWTDGSNKNEKIKKLLPSDMWGDFVK